MKKILVPTDFSAEANNALLFAGFIAKASQAQVILVHVTDVPATQPDTLMSRFEQMIDHSHSNARKILKSIRQHLVQAGAKNIRYVFKEGNLLNELTSVVKKEKIDLLVMGTKRYHNFIEVVSGSNTFDIIEEKICPVLVVPEGAHYNEFAHIILATDYEPIENVATLAPMKFLASLFHSSIEVVHVQQEIGVMLDQEDRSVRQLKQQLTLSNHVRFKVVEGDDIAEALNDYIKEQQPGLLVLISRKRGFLHNLVHHSIVREMVHAPHTPLLVLPELEAMKSTKKFPPHRKHQSHESSSL